jgi:hypothetical protein
MNKNWMRHERAASWQMTAKLVSIKNAECKFGSCARKAVRLTLGDLLIVAKRQLRSTRVILIDQQKSAAGIVL